MLNLSTPIVLPEHLVDALTDPRLVILDATVNAKPSDPHIPGALVADIEGPWSDPASPLPHQRPKPEVIEGEMRRVGINDDSFVVVYEQGPMFSAPRIWWLLRAAGFDNVAVLHGGFTAWAAAGLPVETLPTPMPDMGDVEISPRPGMFVDEDAVRDHVSAQDRVLVDARSHGRFTGVDPEPREGLRGGHIPTAQNVPYTDIQRNNGLVPLDELREIFDSVTDSRPIITSCGSGLTACVLALGLAYLGRDDVSVYDGSWTDWGRAGGPPVETGEAKPLK